MRIMEAAPCKKPPSQALRAFLPPLPPPSLLPPISTDNLFGGFRFRFGWRRHQLDERDVAEAEADFAAARVNQLGRLMTARALLSRDMKINLTPSFPAVAGGKTKARPRHFRKQQQQP